MFHSKTMSYSGIRRISDSWKLPVYLHSAIKEDSASICRNSFSFQLCGSTLTIQVLIIK